MSGYNTECWPDRIEIDGEPNELQDTTFHHKLTVVFACGRRVPYSCSYRYKPAENRRLCRRCQAKREKRRLTWEEIDEHYLAEYRRVSAREQPDGDAERARPAAGPIQRTGRPDERACPPTTVDHD